MIIKSWDSECRASKPGLSRRWVPEGMCDNNKRVFEEGEAGGGGYPGFCLGYSESEGSGVTWAGIEPRIHKLEAEHLTF